MAHKRNPVAAVSVLACTKRTPGLVATVLAAMEQEHERAAGAWQAEWGTLPDLLRLTGRRPPGRDLLEHLEVDPSAWHANLGALGAPPRRPEPRPAGAGELVDRALDARGARA